MKKKITKAIIPAAGLGTRFLPQTKAMPKEMLPIIDKPIIQLAVEELVGAGVTDIIIVTGQQKRAIEDHFDRSVELEQALLEKGKDEAAKTIRDIAEMANFIYVRQKGEPKGNARPVLNSAHLLSDEPFFYFYPDDFYITDGKSSAQQLLEAYQKYEAPVVALTEVEKQEVSKYGVINPGEKLEEDLYDVKQLVEKPSVEETPSTLASVNGYVLTTDLIPYIESIPADKGGEIGVSNALGEYMKDHQVVGKSIDGEYVDCGNKEGYLRAIMLTAKRDGLLK